MARYVIKDGKPVLDEPDTQDHPEGNRAREADGTPVDSNTGRPVPKAPSPGGDPGTHENQRPPIAEEEN